MSSKGFNHFPKLIKDFPQAIEAGLSAVGMLVEGDAKLLAPVDSGALRSDINYQVDMSEEVVRIGTAMEYGPYVEFGTGIFAEGGNGRKSRWRYKTKDGVFVWTRGAKPQPFLRPALDENKDNIKKCFDETITNVIQEIL